MKKEDKNLEQIFSQTVAEVLGVSKLEENLYIPEVIITTKKKRKKEDALTESGKGISEEHAFSLGSKLEFKLVEFGSWEEFKEALVDFKLSQLVYEKITGEMIS